MHLSEHAESIRIAPILQLFLNLCVPGFKQCHLLSNDIVCHNIQWVVIRINKLPVLTVAVLIGDDNGGTGLQ